VKELALNLRYRMELLPLSGAICFCPRIYRAHLMVLWLVCSTKMVILVLEFLSPTAKANQSMPILH